MATLLIRTLRWEVPPAYTCKVFVEIHVRHGLANAYQNYDDVDSFSYRMWAVDGSDNLLKEFKKSDFGFVTVLAAVVAADFVFKKWLPELCKTG